MLSANQLSEVLSSFGTSEHPGEGPIAREKVCRWIKEALLG